MTRPARGFALAPDVARKLTITVSILAAASAFAAEPEGEAPPPLVSSSSDVAVPASTPAPASSPAPEPAAEATATQYTVTADRLDTRRIGGSANVVTEETIERFEHDDAHRVLGQVPGVYLREEDGYGLRPNIGMRGASSDRSAKVTLMEDGVLLAPAPYSAPAAYFFPLMSRMTAVEVYKGPASIRFGPNTIGGALNFVGRPIPFGREAALDVGAGDFHAGKLHGRYGTGSPDGARGWSVEGMHLQTDGYKRLDGGGSTGFDKNEIVVKGFLAGGTPAFQQRSELKLGFSSELSDETYLGLTNDDFRSDPWRRYVASQHDRMEWTRTQAVWSYGFAASSVDGVFTVYRHDFDRSWRKLNGFAGGPALEDVLANPDSGQTAVYAAILRGELDSSQPDEDLFVGENHRTFVSQGMQFRGAVHFVTGIVEHSLEAGARLHGDSIHRKHTEDRYSMLDGALEAQDVPTETRVDSRASATALATHVQDEIRFGRFIFTPGARVEWIETRLRDHLEGSRRRATDVVALPGAGIFMDIGKGFGALAGVHEGFSPVAPGQPAAVEPEKSVNYEAGARWTTELAQAELLGFFSDYRNITGECTFSGGCTDDLTAQFNGGRAQVWGVESLAKRSFEGPRSLRVGLEAAWTWTETMFLEDFVSANPQWGTVEAGDELPYVPRHRVGGTLNAGGPRWEIAATVAHETEMREEAGRGTPPPHLRTDAHTVVDLAARWRFDARGEVYLTLQNALGEEYLVSHRPFGARPGKRRDFHVGLKYRFGG